MLRSLKLSFTSCHLFHVIRFASFNNDLMTINDLMTSQKSGWLKSINQMRKTQMAANSTVFVRKIPGGLRIG